jgi:hypothetical protein
MVLFPQALAAESRDAGRVERTAPTPEQLATTSCTTIRCQLDARWALQPNEGERLWEAATAAASVERSDLIPTRESKVSPAFTEEQLVNRYADRATFDAVLRAVGWPEEQLDKAWAVARCEAPSEFTGVGPQGGVDGLAVGPGFELGWFQIHSIHWDAETAKFYGFVPVFADFDLLNPLENALAALFLWENGGWGHWQCHNLGRAG